MQPSKTFAAVLDFLDALLQFMAARILSKKERPLSNQELIFLNYVITRTALIPVNIILYLETSETTSKRLLVYSSLFYDSLAMVQYLIIIHLVVDQCVVLTSKLRYRIKFMARTTRIAISVCWIIAGVIIMAEIVAWDLTRPHRVRGMYLLRIVPLFQVIFVLTINILLVYFCCKDRRSSYIGILPISPQRRKMLYLSLIVTSVFTLMVVVPDIIRVALISSSCIGCSFQIDWHILHSLSGIIITLIGIFIIKGNPVFSTRHVAKEKASNTFVCEPDLPLQNISHAPYVYIEASQSRANSQMDEEEC